MKILITGANGFVGKHLTSRLQSKQYKIYLCAGPNKSNQENFDFFLDLKNKNQIDNIIKQTKPDTIIHLASQSNVPKAWEYPVETVETNIEGTLNLFEAVLKFTSKSKFIIIGSGEEYGLSGRNGKHLTEEDPCQPQNPYATSKFATGQICLQLAKKHNLNLIHTRSFNHFGPYQKRGFVISDFASQIAEIEILKKAPLIKVGDLTPKRDFTYIEDIINAYVSLIETPVETGIYNICSGVPYSIQEILNYLISFSKTKIEVTVDEAKLRPSDIPVFTGSSQKIHQNTGWEPEISIEEGLKRTLNWWRDFYTGK